MAKEKSRTWEDVKEDTCKLWGKCSRCPYSKWKSIVGGHYQCGHYLNPKNKSEAAK